MSWISITSTLVTAQFSSAEKAAYDAHRGDDKIANIISSVVREVRGYVGNKYPLESGETIPDSLEGAAIAIIRYRFLNGLPSKTLITEDRRNEYNDAMTLLRKVSEGSFLIEDSSGARANGIKIVGSRTTRVTGTSLKGL